MTALPLQLQREECRQRSCGPFPETSASPRSRASSPRALPTPVPTPNTGKGERSLWQRHNGFCPFRAAEWQLDQPSWSGRLRITAKGQMAYIKLEDRTSGKGQGGLCGAEGPRLPLCEWRGGHGLAKPLGIRGSVLEIRARVYLYIDSIPQPLV